MKDDVDGINLSSQERRRQSSQTLSLVEANSFQLTNLPLALDRLLEKYRAERWQASSRFKRGSGLGPGRDGQECHHSHHG